MTAKFEVKSSKNGQCYFHLKAANGKNILASEMYQSKASAQNGIASVRRNAIVRERFEERLSSSNQPYFVLKAGNGEIIGQSQMYADPSGVAAGIEAVMHAAPQAIVADLVGASA